MPPVAVPLTVDPDGDRGQHFHRALSKAKKYAERLRHAARRTDVQKLLETLAALEAVEAIDDGAYAT